MKAIYSDTLEEALRDPQAQEQLRLLLSGQVKEIIINEKVYRLGNVYTEAQKRGYREAANQMGWDVPAEFRS